MNIHFTDKKLFRNLQSATIAKVVVGSHMYGTNNENSDVDYLYIYATSHNELTSAIQTHHQLQYIDDEGNDHNFVSLHSFIRNALNGDSTINFEVIQSNVLSSTQIYWLNSINLKEAFCTYTIIRSYLGLCRRDVKHYHKANTDYLKKKRLGHIIRGALYASDLINNNFQFDLVNKDFKRIYNELDVSNNNELKKYDAHVSNLRNILNEKLNNKTLGLAQNMDIENAMILTNYINAFCASQYFKDKQEYLKDFDMSYFINAFENWVEY